MREKCGLFINFINTHLPKNKCLINNKLNQPEIKRKINLVKEEHISCRKLEGFCKEVWKIKPRKVIKRPLILYKLYEFSEVFKILSDALPYYGKQHII